MEFCRLPTCYLNKTVQFRDYQLLIMIKIKNWLTSEKKNRKKKKKNRHLNTRPYHHLTSQHPSQHSSHTEGFSFFVNYIFSHIRRQDLMSRSGLRRPWGKNPFSIFKLTFVPSEFNPRHLSIIMKFLLLRRGESLIKGQVFLPSCWGPRYNRFTACGKPMTSNLSRPRPTI